MVKQVVINEGSNERLQWEETLEEKEDVYLKQKIENEN